jgi:hypothetical protein
MSNILTTNPILLDTASTSSVIITRDFWVTAIEWDSGASGVVGDTVVLKDKDGNILFDLALNVAKGSEPRHFHQPVLCHGLIAHTIAHGTVYLYTKEARNG